MTIDDQSGLGCIAGVSSECKYAGCLDESRKYLIGNCADLKIMRYYTYIAPPKSQTISLPKSPKLLLPKG